MSDPVQEFEVALGKYQEADIRLSCTSYHRDDIAWSFATVAVEDAKRGIADLMIEHGPAIIARLRAAEEAAEKYRKIILRDAGAPDDADNICCCGGKLDEAGVGWPCSHGGCRSMADYYLSTKLEALSCSPEEPKP